MQIAGNRGGAWKPELMLWGHEGGGRPGIKGDRCCDGCGVQTTLKFDDWLERGLFY